MGVPGVDGGGVVVGSAAYFVDMLAAGCQQEGRDEDREGEEEALRT